MARQESPLGLNCGWKMVTTQFMVSPLIGIQKKYKLKLEAGEPKRSQDNKNLYFCRFTLANSSIQLAATTVVNTKINNSPEIDAIEFRKCVFSDLTHHELLIVANCIFSGNFQIRKHGLFRKKNKVVVIADGGKLEIEPRVVL